MKVLMTGGGTGGHVNPALAMAGTIRENAKDAEIAFVGTKTGIENKLVPKEGYKLYHVEVKGFKRSLAPSNIKALILAYTSPIKAEKIIKEFKPDLVVGTGGYVCWPVIKAAARAGIPTALHESNAVPGFTVKMLEKYTDKIFVNFEETKKYLKFPDKAVRVGNPIRSEFFKLDYEKARRSLGIEGKYKLFLLSCGGSMGAEPINNEAISFMDSYVKYHPEIYHLHASGAIEYEAAKRQFENLGLNSYKNIELVEYIYDMPQRMAAADLVINRAGATTLSELAALGKPCVLIPSPYVTNNHQYKNAKVLADQGAAVVIEEKDLTEDKFKKTVCGIIGDEGKLKEMAENIGKFAVTDPSKIIYKELMALAKIKNI